MAIYNRVSTEKMAQKEAIEHQVEESRCLVESSKLRIVRQYVEMESATSVEKRKQYQKMIEDMEADIFDLLVVKSQDRIMRDQAEWHLLKRTLNRCQKKLYFYMEDEVFDQRENGLKHDIQAMLDEYESERKSKKASHSHHRRQVSYEGPACLNITRPIFGWDRKVSYDENGKKSISFVVNEKERQSILEACWYVENGYNFTDISNLMYQRGVLSKATNGMKPQEPKKISSTSWKKILLSPLLHGDAVMNQRQTDFYSKKRVAVPREEWVYRQNVIPAILDKGYHEKIIKIILK